MTISEKELEKKIGKLEKKFKKELSEGNTDSVFDKILDSKSWTKKFEDAKFLSQCDIVKETHESYLSQHIKDKNNAKEYDSHEHKRNIAIVLKHASTVKGMSL